MKSILLAAGLLITQTIPNSAQSLFVAQDYSDFFEWFHERSQVDQLYSDHTTLYTFIDNTKVRKSPSATSALLTQLPIGYPVTNIAYNDETDLPITEVAGYTDFWYHVKGRDAQGKAFVGYVWGGHIAKGWRDADLTGDGKDEFVMLGISTLPRKKMADIKAEIRVIQNKRLISQTMVPGICVFQECDASPMIRVMKSKATPGLTIVEASTMTMGCMTGIDKAFFFWNGSNLERVYQAEYSTQKEMYRKKFVVAPNQQASNVQVCEYGGEDQHYNPIWNCKTIPASSIQESKAVVAAK